MIVDFQFLRVFESSIARLRILKVDDGHRCRLISLLMIRLRLLLLLLRDVQLGSSQGSGQEQRYGGNKSQHYKGHLGKSTGRFDSNPNGEITLIRTST